MTRRSLTLTLALLATLLPSSFAAAGRYNYGGGGAGTGEPGYLVVVEAGAANPRNTDNNVAAAGPNVVIPQWDDEFAGRIGLGYRFGGGSQLLVSFWGFQAERGSFSVPAGPVSGFSFDVATEIEARTVDASWGSAVEATDALQVEWSAGLRYAGFEETTGGIYATTGGPWAVAKVNQGDMLGARLAGRATYRRGRLSAGAGMGLSLLDGEIEAQTSLTSQPAGAWLFTDDSRSGTILDLEVRGTWHAVDDRLAFWIGWEEQVWDGTAADLAGDSVTFSWLKAGVSFRF